MRNDPTIRARNTDPESSHLAAEMHQPKLSVRRKLVMTFVINNPDCTSGELSRLMYERYIMPMRVAAETPHKRLPELERLGLVVRSEDTRKCRDSGYQCYTWRAVK